MILLKTIETSFPRFPVPTRDKTNMLSSL